MWGDLKPCHMVMSSSGNAVTWGHVIRCCEIVTSIIWHIVLPDAIMWSDVTWCCNDFVYCKQLKFLENQIFATRKILGAIVLAEIKSRISIHSHLATSLVRPFNEECEEDQYNCHAFRKRLRNVKETFNFLSPHFPERGWQQLVAGALSKSEAWVFRTCW